MENNPLYPSSSGPAAPIVPPQQPFLKRHALFIITVFVLIFVAVGIVVVHGIRDMRASISNVRATVNQLSGELTVNWESANIERVDVYLLHITVTDLTRPIAEDVENTGNYSYVIEGIGAMRDYDGPFKVVVASAADHSVRAESEPLVIGRPCSVEVCGKSAAGLPASINGTGELGFCDRLVIDDKPQSEIDLCYERTWEMMPKVDRTTKLLCEWPVQTPGVRQIFKKEIRMNVGLDVGKETLVSCGYPEDIGGAGGRLLTYVVDDTGPYGKIIKKVDQVAGESIGGPTAFDANNDGRDEVIWTSTSCAMGYGCDIRYSVYDLQTDQWFYKTVITMKGDMTELGQTTFSENLSDPKNSAFRQFLIMNADVPSIFPEPVRESMR